MRKLKKKVYLGLWSIVFVALVIVRYCFVTTPEAETNQVADNPSPLTPNPSSFTLHPSSLTPNPSSLTPNPSSFPLHPSPPSIGGRPHPIRGVYNYGACFPDVQDVQIVAARKWGVRPVLNRRQAEERKNELVFVGSNPYFVIDRTMSYSTPYLVPRAAELLGDIGHNFLDSLFLKGVPLHRIIVTSVLRTEEDVNRLMRRNGNASDQSCHRFGTTFDIAYNRYNTVQPPGEQRRVVRDDTLKYVLSEVLRDLRQQGRCYVKYEVKQGCFHITTR